MDEFLYKEKPHRWTKSQKKGTKLINREESFNWGDDMEGVFDEEILANVTNFEIMLAIMEKRKGK